MLFSSLTFLFCFLPITVCLYYLIRRELRNYVLLLASIFFYAWGEPKAVLVMLSLIAVSWWIGLLMDKTEGIKRKYLLAGGIILNLATLFFYKYWMFFLGFFIFL